MMAAKGADFHSGLNRPELDPATVDGGITEKD